MKQKFDLALNVEIPDQCVLPSTIPLDSRQPRQEQKRADRAARRLETLPNNLPGIVLYMTMMACPCQGTLTLILRGEI